MALKEKAEKAVEKAVSRADRAAVRSEIPRAPVVEHPYSHDAVAWRRLRGLNFRSAQRTRVDLSYSLDEPAFRDSEELRQKYEGLYNLASPYPHCVIDGLFSDRLLEAVEEDFPNPDASAWRPTEDEQSKVRAVGKGGKGRSLSPATECLLTALASSQFVRFLEQVTGIPGLIPDPHRLGGGLHRIGAGGMLGLHADFNWSETLRLYRRVNVLIYLNRDWKDEYHGALELWDSQLREHVEYAPTWNRTVITNVAADAFHGLPRTVSCPDHMARQSIAAWYYTSGMPVTEQAGYNMFDPDYVDGPQKARLSRRWLPPLVVALVKRWRPKFTHTVSKADLARAASWFLPPGILWRARRKKRVQP